MGESGKKRAALKTRTIKSDDHRCSPQSLFSFSLLSLLLHSLTPSATASAASVAAPAPVAGLASVQGTRPESEEAQGGHSILLSFFFNLSRFFFFIDLDLDLF